jgi:hypothetical protein
MIFLGRVVPHVRNHAEVVHSGIHWLGDRLGSRRDLLKARYLEKSALATIP